VLDERFWLSSLGMGCVLYYFV